MTDDHDDSWTDEQELAHVQELSRRWRQEVWDQHAGMTLAERIRALWPDADTAFHAQLDVGMRLVTHADVDEIQQRLPLPLDAPHAEIAPGTLVAALLFADGTQGVLIVWPDDMGSTLYGGTWHHGEWEYAWGDLGYGVGQHRDEIGIPVFTGVSRELPELAAVDQPGALDA